MSIPHRPPNIGPPRFPTRCGAGKLPFPSTEKGQHIRHVFCKALKLTAIRVPFLQVTC
ncbi:protein of unknown function [Paraburkholderia dioscoreae]|uniref:Uncharacterized protein n=1 Tax=Paraburkholderia dioscoreae TaxID=2604047 RepID=A0A5Q4ZS36_9BURK|nr:protein of unknown function [Paraburkholderia dioscoreae]